MSLYGHAQSFLQKLKGFVTFIERLQVAPAVAAPGVAPAAAAGAPVAAAAVAPAPASGFKRGLRAATASGDDVAHLHGVQLHFRDETVKSAKKPTSSVPAPAASHSVPTEAAPKEMEKQMARMKHLTAGQLQMEHMNAKLEKAIVDLRGKLEKEKAATAQAQKQDAESRALLDAVRQGLAASEKTKQSLSVELKCAKDQHSTELKQRDENIAALQAQLRRLRGEVRTGSTVARRSFDAIARCRHGRQRTRRARCRTGHKLPQRRRSDSTREEQAAKHVPSVLRSAQELHVSAVPCS